MRRLTAGAALASLITVGAAAPAVAKPGPKQPPRTHVYWANLGPVAVGPYAMIPNTRGRAQLVDGKRNDKLSIHVRGLQAGQTYTWHVHQAAAGVSNPCASPAADAASAPGWIYKPLIADPQGNANAQGRSFTFAADPAATYYVDVHMADGSVLVCGVLHGKQKRQAPIKPLKGKGKGHGNAGQPLVIGGSASADGGADDPIEVDAEGDATSEDGADTTTGTGTTSGAGTGTGTPTGTAAGTPTGTGTGTTTGANPAPAPCPHGDDQSDTQDDQGGNQDDQGELENDGEDWGAKGPRRPHHGGHGRD